MYALLASPAAQAVGEAASSYIQRSWQRSSLSRADQADIALPLLAARMTEFAYHAETPAELQAKLHGVIDEAMLLTFHQQEFHAQTAQWFLARGKLPAAVRSSSTVDADDRECLFLVFRGTHSVADILTDLLVRPERTPSGLSFHGGFLACVRDDSRLHALLRIHAMGDVPLYIFGHSLGGSLALTLVEADLLPRCHHGKVSVVALGSPSNIYGPVNVDAIPVSARRASLLVVVNKNDVAPRVLGSPLKLMRAAVAAISGGDATAQPDGSLLETLERYEHPGHVRVLYVSDGQAHRVEPHERVSVLHLADGIHYSGIRDHLEYVAALEACLIL